MKETIFISRHQELKAKLVDFAGWHMPIHYPSGIIQEHLHTRKKAGLFDVSHMGDFFIKDEVASEFIRNLLPFDYTKLDPGCEFYTHILNDDVIILDDTIVMRMDKDEYLMVPNAAPTAKIRDHITRLLPKNVLFEDRTLEMQCIARQEPDDPKVIEKLNDFDLSTIEFFTCKTVTIK